jgi:hypothetical protein
MFLEHDTGRIRRLRPMSEPVESLGFIDFDKRGIYTWVVLPNGVYEASIA